MTDQPKNGTTSVTPQQQTELARYDHFKQMIISDKVRAMIKDAAGGDEAFASRTISNLLTVAGQNKTLLECKPESVLRSACQAAALGLVLEPALKQAHIVPFNSNEGKKAQLIIGYQGYRTLTLNTNRYKTCKVIPWYVGEHVEWDRMADEDARQVKIVVDDAEAVKTKTVAGLMGILREKNGGPEYYVWMTLDEIREHAKRYSKSYDKKNDRFFPDSAWATHFMDMATKTVIRQLLTKNATFSITQARIIEEIETSAEDGEIVDTTWEERPIPDTQVVVPSDVAQVDPTDGGSNPTMAEPVVALVQEAEQAAVNNTVTDQTTGEIIKTTHIEKAEAKTPVTEDEAIQLLVAEHLASSTYSAKNLLKNWVPDDFSGHAETLLQWTRIYRGWRDLDKDTPIAAELATGLVSPV